MSNVDENKKVIGPYKKYTDEEYGCGLDDVAFPIMVDPTDTPDTKPLKVIPKEV